MHGDAPLTEQLEMEGRVEQHQRRLDPNQPESSWVESLPHRSAAGPTKTMKRMISSVPMHGVSTFLTISTSRGNVDNHDGT